MEAGIPNGVINVVTGEGSVVGAALVSHPLVDLVSFTGSVKTGKIVQQNASYKKVVIESGGKSPSFVFEDTNVDELLQNPTFILSMLGHSGQICVLGSRLIVHESLKDILVAKLKERFESYVVGPPSSPEVLGAMPFCYSCITPQFQLETIERLVATALEQGATLVTGGHPLTTGLCEGGRYYAPTLFDNVTEDMSIFQEEVFGPVIAVTTFKDLDEAIRIGNNVTQGLSAMIWSNNIKTVITVAKRIKAGFIMNNTFGAPGINETFGGVKHSGIGSENGLEGIREYLVTKTLVLPY